MKKSIRGNKVYLDEDKINDSQLTRRNFLRLSALAVGGSSMLLDAEDALAENTADYKLRELAEKSIPVELYWQMVRNQFALKKKYTYMNTGTLGCMPKVVIKRLNEYHQTLGELPYPTAFYEPYSLLEVHKKAADFLGATEDEDPVSGAHEVIITNSTTSGMSFVANGLELNAGDEVLCTGHEHMGGLHCWEILRDRRGITLTELPFSGIYDSKQDIVDLFENAITDNTKVISFCHINWTTGLRMPAKELCQLARDNNIISVVDGAHAMGMLDLDMHDLGCDFYTSSCHKWICAPPGVGILYIRDGIGREGDLIERFWPTITEGYHSDSLQMQLELRGQRSVPVLACLGDAIDMHGSIGIDVIEDRVMDLSSYAKAKLTEIPGVKLTCSVDPEMSSGLTAFSVNDKTGMFPYIGMYSKLRDDYNIIARFVPYRDSPDEDQKCVMRICTHIYNNYNQIDRLAQAIEDNLDMMA